MVFHYLSKRRAAVGLESPLLGLMWCWLRPESEISSTGPLWVWNEKISKKFLFSLQFIQQKQLIWVYIKMPETQFLFFTKWQEQKRRKFNIDPYMLIQETGIQKIRKQEFKSKKWAAAKQLILQQPILLIFSFSVWSRERFQLQLSLLHQAAPTARFEPYLRQPELH